MFEKFNHDSLKSIVGEVVSVTDSDSGEQFDAKVANVRESPSNGDEWEAFATTLRVEPGVCQLKQGNYKLKHEKFGEVELFSSPNDELTLEFVISRKRTPSS